MFIMRLIPLDLKKTKGFLSCALTTLGVNASQALIPTPKTLSHANPMDLLSTVKTAGGNV